MPEGVHPLAWTLLGFGLDSDVLDSLARHLFDNLGCRFNPPEEPEITRFDWAVSYPLDPGERIVAAVGDDVDVLVPGGDRAAVSITSGALPPGIRLEKSTGRLVGAFTDPGLYSVTVTVFPTVKWDPMGGPGGPDSAGKWIPVETPRFVPEVEPVPDTARLDELSDDELEAVIVAARRAQAAKTIRAAEGGVPDGN
ncbi:hypothetical protein CPHO_07040 [Corynebacterium phocae]|uniref:Uncharacterized protein n=2 Tax=Corynebacterium phocae TaxID=161895 RepID=A0A1L7D3G1_9CORY|nr:hypothetical protein CPHO_07040 [Corynebacterium phocae]